MPRRVALLAVPLVLAACAGSRLAVPTGADLDRGQRAAYRDALTAWIADDAAATIDALGDLLAVEPWYVPAHVLAQDAERARGRGAAAEAWYASEAAAHPDDGARLLLAARLLPRGDGAREQAYRRAASLLPGSPWPTAALAYELHRAALEAHDAAIALSDAGFEERAEELRGLALDRHREARELSEALAASQPDLAEAQALAAEIALGRGVALDRSESVERALAFAERAAELDPSNPAWHVLVARVRRELIDDLGAETALRAALDVDPGDGVLLGALGRVLLDLGRFDAAAAILEEAHRARPEDVETATDLAVARQRTGDLDGCAEGLRAAAALDPGDARPLEALAIVELERGDRAAAAQALREYIARGGPEATWAEGLLAELRTAREAADPAPADGP